MKILFIGALAVFLPFAASALADDLRIAENILLYQRKTGGWPKNYDRKQEMTDAQRGPWKGRFFTIWTGQALSLMGSALVRFALIWWMTETTGSATVLTVSTLVALLPPIVLGPLVGTLVDRWTRRWIMVDLGIGFGDMETAPGVEVMLPDAADLWDPTLRGIDEILDDVEAMLKFRLS